MPLLKKLIRVFLITVIVFVTVVIAIISPLTKYLIQKYDVKYTGREIKMDWVYVNPFTGYVHFKNLKVYELKGDTVFFSTEGLSANMAMHKLFSKTYEISELALTNPQGYVIQNEKHFNFSDLITKFSPKEKEEKNKEPLHLNILNIKICNGTFYYHENEPPINYFVKNVNLESAGFRWDADTIPINFSFLSGVGKGDAKGAITINSKTKDYRLGIVVQKFDLNFIGQYIKDLSNYGSFKAFLDADFKSKGNFIERENVTNTGLISVSDFHFGKDSTEDFAAFDNLTIAIEQVSPKKFIYKFDSISLINSYLKYEKYDYLDNVQTMFGKKGANIKAANADEEKFNLVIELVKYIRTLSKNLLRSNYSMDRLGVYNGRITYNDYSLGEKFALKLDSINFIADSVDKTHPRVNFELSSGIHPYGNIDIGVSINPTDSSDFDLKYHFQKIPLSMFNPYVIKYTSFPLDRGTLELKGLWNVRNGEIKSHNHLILIDPRVGEKSRNENAKWMPLRLVMFFERKRQCNRLRSANCWQLKKSKI